MGKQPDKKPGRAWPVNPVTGKKEFGRKEIDLSGKTFGRWTVIEKTNHKTTNGRLWKCQCICGNVKEVPARYIRDGVSTSCGCYFRETAIKKLENANRYTPTITGAASYMLESKGKKQTLKDWSKQTGLPLSVLIRRLNRGWRDEDMLELRISDYERMFAIPDPLFDIFGDPEDDWKPEEEEAA